VKILEPIPREKIPPRRGGVVGGAHKFRSFYEQVMALDGQALPAKFDDSKSAEKFVTLINHAGGKGRRLGLRATQRGNVVYVYKDSS
jgi:hypothetical protein